LKWSDGSEGRGIAQIKGDREGERGKKAKIGQKSEMGWAQMGYR
jgi:hypothetical protein